MHSAQRFFPLTPLFIYVSLIDSTTHNDFSPIPNPNQHRKIDVSWHDKRQRRVFFHIILITQRFYRNSSRHVFFPHPNDGILFHFQISFSEREKMMMRKNFNLKFCNPRIFQRDLWVARGSNNDFEEISNFGIRFELVKSKIRYKSRHIRILQRGEHLKHLELENFDSKKKNFRQEAIFEY